MTQCSVGLSDCMTGCLPHCPTVCSVPLSLPACSVSPCIAVSQLDIDGGGMQVSGNKVERSCEIQLLNRLQHGLLMNTGRKWVERGRLYELIWQITEYDMV